MHEHSICEHELKYCPICDTVWCTKCNKEWKNLTYPYTVTYPNTTYYPIGDKISDPVGTITINCTHNKE
jgi:hypothetical protein